jgi:prepilin-type N-terminal cleavage/methylation domain-containing protein
MNARASRLVSRAGRVAGGRGFTLLETSMALVIIGVGVLAFVEAQKSFVENNNWSSQAATATLLANEIRELTRNLPRHDPVTGLYLSNNNGQSVLGGWGRESGEVTVTDLDDLDDFDGLVFGNAGTTDGRDGVFLGPISAFGDTIQQINNDGELVFDAEGNARALEGWTQQVTVEKVDPQNFGRVRADNYVDVAAGTFPGRAVDQFPVRVTVVVEFQGPFDNAPREITRVMWIVSP